MYLPLHVGSACHDPLPFQRDDEGENISSKNPYFCELTGLYWAWKHLDADYVGLCHYRRYFAGHGAAVKGKHIASRQELEALLRTGDAILPRKRNYWIETNYTQYIHAHHKEDLDTVREILCRRHPGYVAAFDSYMARTKGHQFNMFVMKKPLLDAYCTWLFDVLFALEQQLDISAYSVSDQRVFGYVSERLLDTWMETNGVRYEELPVVNLEPQNWLKKGGNFLLRKWRGGK